MKKLKCIICKLVKDEIEFHYDYFKGYENECRKCKEKIKKMNDPTNV